MTGFLRAPMLLLTALSGCNWFSSPSSDQTEPQSTCATKPGSLECAKEAYPQDSTVTSTSTEGYGTDTYELIKFGTIDWNVDCGTRNGHALIPLRSEYATKVVKGEVIEAQQFDPTHFCVSLESLKVYGG